MQSDSRLVAFLPMDVKSYRQHFLHRQDQAWPETNCYVDVWIEILHSLKLEPSACLAMALAVDFDGDQWTFFKPPHEDLHQLYGIDIQELNVWRSLLDNTKEQLRQGRIVLAEVDAYYLPDTVATDYRRQHTKTTIGIQDIDVHARSLSYFHNGGYFSLSGEDFSKIFRLDVPFDPTYMPFFAEFVRLDHLKRRDDSELAPIARNILQKHFARRPSTNPFINYKAKFNQDIEWMRAGGMARYHAYSFANIRQFGAAYAMSEHFLRWMVQSKALPSSCLGVAGDFGTISQTAKAMLLKTARAIAGTKPVDFSPMLDEFVLNWQKGMDTLKAELS